MRVYEIGFTVEVRASDYPLSTGVHRATALVSAGSEYDAVRLFVAGLERGMLEARKAFEASRALEEA